MSALTTVVSAVAGGTGSLLPAAMDIFKQRQDNAHELDMKKVDADLLKDGKVLEYKTAELAADTEEIKGVYATAEDPGFPWMAAFQASVRPTVTYAFFGLFLAVKLSSVHYAWAVEHTSLTAALNAIWDENTEALFAATLGFWFGARSISKFGYGAKKK